MNKVTLFQLDTKQKVREWSIKVESHIDDTADIIVEAGIKGGKLIKTVTPIEVGLNIGKVNETTPYQQAVKDAKSVLDAQIKKGYVEDITQIKSKNETSTIKKPMKGEKYHPTGKNKCKTLDELGRRGKLVLLQKKFDGYRYRIHVTPDEITFYSSSGDMVIPFPHIEASIRKSFDKIYKYVNEKYGIEEYYLDGEIYNHKLGFYAVSSACGSQVHLTPEKIALRAQMQFHLFDVCLDAPYKVRQKVLPYFKDEPTVVIVESKEVIAEEEAIENFFEEALNEGYEGLMIRQTDMPYEFKRSKQLIKYKPLIDDEFKIIGFKKSITGNTLGSLICEMPDGRSFKCDLKGAIGSDKVKQKIWDNQADYLGKWITVEFLEYTKPEPGYKTGVPRNNKGKAFRKGQGID